MARIVVADASPLIGLAIVDGLPWLTALFGEVWLPEIVRSEVLPGKQARGEATIQAALDADLLKVWEHPIPPLTGFDLDEGESACISLALHYPDPVLLIIDERSGRAVAQEKGLTVTGTAAIIGMAKQRGLIPSAWQVFETLHQADFRIAAVIIRQILARVGEAEVYRATNP